MSDTDTRLYNIEKMYWELIVACQDLLLANATSDLDGGKNAYESIRTKVLDYRENGLTYMTARKWDESDGE